MAKRSTNMETARDAAFDVYKALGLDWQRGQASIPNLFQRIVMDATIGLIEAADAKRVLNAWASGSGNQAGN
jgi:hypothetical protein